LLSRLEERTYVALELFDAAERRRALGGSCADFVRTPGANREQSPRSSTSSAELESQAAPTCFQPAYRHFDAGPGARLAITIGKALL
jgi:hypothetical protein